MTFSRYARTSVLNLGTQFGTSRAIEAIRKGIASGQIKVSKQVVVRGAERLDTLAGDLYGDARYWWILAAASDVGWGLQVPVGTLLTVPVLGDIASLIG
jgi:hypothetical protein